MTPLRNAAPRVAAIGLAVGVTAAGLFGVNAATDSAATDRAASGSGCRPQTSGIDPAATVSCTPGADYASPPVAVQATDPAGAGAAPEQAPAPAVPATGTPTPGGPTAAAEGLPVSYYVRDTVSRVAKMQSNLSIGEGRFEARQVLQKPYPISGDLTLPSADGYFVNFGFMPVTATVEMVQGGPTTGNLNNVKLGGGGIEGDIDTTLQVSVRLRNVRVDGMPLDVGPNCQTGAPAAVRAQGHVVIRDNPAEAPPTPLESFFEIPPFAGCGATEDLDPLLTGLISGPGNKMNTTLVLRCFNNKNCPPEGA